MVESEQPSLAAEDEAEIEKCVAEFAEAQAEDMADMAYFEHARAGYSLATERLNAYSMVLAELHKMCGRIELDERLREENNPALARLSTQAYKQILKDIVTISVTEPALLGWGDDV